MNTTNNFNAQPQLIAVSRLETSPLNVRKTLTRAGIEEMKASIEAHGLIHNLVVYDAGDGVFHVVAGSRRLAAIHALQAEGLLHADFAVACQIVTADHAREMSLAENTVRRAMHPADQFEAFAALIDDGQTATEVAGRFGVEESLVLKRMKLARVAPKLLQEYRDDQLTLECLMAFTLSDDHKRQLKVYKSLQGWQKNDPRHIRACLTEKLIDADSKLARFVGLEAYTEAGGTRRADLFGDDVYLEKPALLHKLAEAKLSGIRRELEAEGWGWVEIKPERDWDFVNKCSRIKPRLIGAPAELVAEHERMQVELAEIEQSLEESESDESAEALDEAEAMLAAVEEKLAAFVGFDTEHQALAGCFVSIGQDGTPFIDKGLVKPEHRKQLASLLGDDAGEGMAAKAKPTDGLTQALRRDLAAYRQHAAQAEIARHPEIAFDLLAFNAASSLLGKQTPLDGPDVHFQPNRPKPGVAHHAAADPLAGIRVTLPLTWLKPKTEAARFAAFRELTAEAKQQLLAWCVAATLEPKLAPAEEEGATAYDLALSLTGADVAAYWRPTKANFLSRITRDALLAIGREALGEAWAQSRWKDKKAALVEQLDRAFAAPDKSGRTPDQAERLKRWLPARMAFAIPAEPKPAKARKAKKAA